MLLPNMVKELLLISMRRNTALIHMAIHTSEYCSLHYLNQWLSYDRHYCDALSKDDEIKKLSALKSAGGFYRVARNLPSEFDERRGLKRYQPVLRNT